jgi:8-oxo-dGTP diphosphatase
VDYVAGFLFSGDREWVVLVEKIRPDWQRGRLNGVGGKIEASDASPVAAMVREFEEEAGLRVHGWEKFCEIQRLGDLTHFFRSFAEGPVGHVSGIEEEKVSAYPVSEVARLNTMPNLRWLIPMALDAAARATVEYAATAP